MKAEYDCGECIMRPRQQAADAWAVSFGNIQEAAKGLHEE